MNTGSHTPTTDCDLDLLRQKVRTMDEEIAALREAVKKFNERLTALARNRSEVLKAIARHTLASGG